MWSKLPDEKVMWQDAGNTVVYDEAGLRRCIRGYLTDESRARFGEKTLAQTSAFLKDSNT